MEQPLFIPASVVRTPDKNLSQVQLAHAVPHLEADRMMHPQSTLPTDGGLP